MTFTTANPKITRMNAPPDADPWYRAGLQFRCTQCGNCCTGAPGFVWVSEAELHAIAKFLGEPLEEVRALHTYVARNGRTLREKAGGDCVFFDRSAGCTIYPVRPTQCRTWPFWESNVSTPNHWQETRDICPGAGQGDLISVEEITNRMNAIRM